MLSPMTSSGITPGRCFLKFSPYIIGELVTTAINDFGAMVAKKPMSLSTGPARSDNFENKDG